MDQADIIYVSLLVFSIIFGLVYRKIPSKTQKQWVGSILGLVLIYIVSGAHSLHPIVLVLLNLVILNFVDKRYVYYIAK